MEHMESHLQEGLLWLLLQKNDHYHAYNSPCDAPSNCNKTHEEGDQKQNSEEVIWTSSLVNLVWRLVVVHQGNLYGDKERRFYFLMLRNNSVKQFKWWYKKT